MENAVCPICKNPKKSSSAGRLTQWIVACTCDLAELQIESGQDVSVSICRECGKRIGEGRSGSFTQFIFRFDICQCRVPSPIKRVLEIQPQKEEDYYVNLEEEPELALDKSKFPTDRYKALSRLGQGGGGTVYLARDRLLNKLVAVKVLSMSQVKQLTAFQEEAKATSKLNHPSIVSLLDFGLTESEVPYMVLEHIPGSSLEDFISKEGPMEWRVARYVFAQICDALDYSHTHMILHRDIKPSNILLFQNQTGYLDVKLIDFGIAKIKSEGQNGDQSATMAGAPLYMSPDVGLGREYDQRSEVYSLGCVLYETLTGKPPFEGHNALQTLVMHAEDVPALIDDLVDIEFPKELGPIVAKSLEKDPKDRYQSMSEFRNAMLSIEPEPRVGEGTVTMMGTPVWRPTREQVAIAIAVVVGLGCVVGYRAYVSLEKGIAKKGVQLKKELYKQKAFEAAKPTSTEAMAKNVEDGLRAVGFEETDQKWVEHPPGYFTGHEVGDDDFKELKDKDITRLELNLGKSFASGVGFKYLVGKPITVVFSKSEELNDEGAHELAKIKSIRRLMIHFSNKLTEKGLKDIATLPNLITLQLRFNPELPPNAVKAVSKSTSLSNLDLGHSRPIKLEDFANLTKMKNLTMLTLTRTDVFDDHLPTLAKCPALKVLEIRGVKLSEAGFVSLARLKSLTRMKIDLEGAITSLAVKKFQKEREKMGLPEVKLIIGPSLQG